MNAVAWILFIFLALVLGGANLVIWVEAARRAKRRARRSAMRRHRLIVGYPGNPGYPGDLDPGRNSTGVATGDEDDPYLAPWVDAVEKLESK